MFTISPESIGRSQVRRICLALGLSVVTFGLASAASAGVTVKFVDAKHFTDATWDGRMGANNDVLAALEKHLQTEAGKCLAADQNLVVEVLNIDLAGRESRRIPPRNYRVMTEVDWPSMEVHVVRSAADGAVLEDVKETVADMSYLQQRPYIATRNEPLVFDKYMLTRWINKRFCSLQH